MSKTLWDSDTMVLRLAFTFSQVLEKKIRCNFHATDIPKLTSARVPSFPTFCEILEIIELLELAEESVRLLL